MLRKEALALVGTRVSTWSQTSGLYVGTLVEVTADRPWRAVVEVDGILEPAWVVEHGRPVPRRGHRVGERIEVGGSSVEPTVAAGEADYLALLLRKAESFEAGDRAWREGRHGRPDDPGVARLYAWHAPAAAAVRRVAAMLADLHRLEALLAGEGGREAVRAAVAEMARAGELGPGRERQLERPGHAWDSVAFAVVRDVNGDPEARRALLDGLEARLAPAAGTGGPGGP